MVLISNGRRAFGDFSFYFFFFFCLLSRKRSKDRPYRTVPRAARHGVISRHNGEGAGKLVINQMARVRGARRDSLPYSGYPANRLASRTLEREEAAYQLLLAGLAFVYPADVSLIRARLSRPPVSPCAESSSPRGVTNVRRARARARVYVLIADRYTSGSDSRSARISVTRFCLETSRFSPFPSLPVPMEGPRRSWQS